MLEELKIENIIYEIIECKDKIDELFDKFETKRIEKQKIFFNEKYMIVIV